MSRSVIWRRRLWRWVPALAFVILNVAGLSVYRVVIAGQLGGLDQRLESREEALTALVDRREEVEGLLESAELNRRRIDELYEKTFATRRARLTRVIEEVKDLARRSGLDPQTIAYPEAAIEEFALVERSFVFDVRGTYQELRTFLNLMELTPSFITLRRIGLSGGSTEEGLGIRLTLSTLFSEDDLAADPAADLVTAEVGG